MLRRQFTATLAGMAAPPPPPMLFSARSRNGFLNLDRRLALLRPGASRPDYLKLDATGQASWGAYGEFSDGRLLLQSLAVPADWKSRSFDDYYPKSTTKIWRYDLATAALEELVTRDRASNFTSPCLILPGEQRLAVTALVNGKSILYTTDLDGRHPTALTRPDEFVYGVSLSPDGKRFACHANYRIVVLNVDGTQRREIAAERGLLHFGTSWSPDGEWVLFQVCDSKSDPAHDWSAIAIARPDGSELRRLTPPASAWFGSSFGPRHNPGGGSILPQWSPDGRNILYSKRSPGAKTPWEFQPGRPDRDHYNRDFKPELARGGAALCLHHVATGESRLLTHPAEGQWDFRGVFSPNGQSVAFARARTGRDPELWLVQCDRPGREHRLTQGGPGGADFPLWLHGPQPHRR